MYWRLCWPFLPLTLLFDPGFASKAPSDSSSCSATCKITHHWHYNITVTSLTLHYCEKHWHNNIIVTSLTLQHYCNITSTTTLPLQHQHYNITVTPPITNTTLLQHHWHYNITVTSTLQHYCKKHWHYNNTITSLTLQHYCNITDTTVTLMTS